MFQQQVYIINTLLMGLDALAVIAAGYSAYFLNLGREAPQPTGPMFMAAVTGIVFINNYLFGHCKLYSDRPPAGIPALVSAIAKVIVIEFTLLFAILFLMQAQAVSRPFLLSFAGFSLLYLTASRLVALFVMQRTSKRGFHNRKILVIGDRQRGLVVNEVLENQLSWGHEIIGWLTTDREERGAGHPAPVLGDIDALPGVLRSLPVDEVVFALPGGRDIDLDGYLGLCRKMGVAVRILPALWQPGGHQISVEKCQGVPFLNILAGNFNANGLLYKRLLDIGGGLAGTLIFLLLYLPVGLAIKLDSPGPILFSQVRKGQHGRTFKLYKFRTMHLDAEQMKQQLLARNEMQGHMFKLKDDPRITRVGKWLRETSIDEFPQFLNVLKGEMSLVGTRPPTIDEVEKYQPEHLRRIAAKPGITGMWQVSGRNRITDFEEVVRLDCAYLDNWRFSDDLRILARTAWMVLQRKGAV